MKKILALIMAGILLGIPACTSRPSIELDVSAFYPDTEAFSYPGVSYGDSLEETEEKLGYQLAGHSYTELMQQQLDKYGNANSAGAEAMQPEQATYIGNIGDKSILVEYGEARGHLLFEYYRGQLISVGVLFGTQETAMGSEIDYGGVDNDVEAIYQQLAAELEEDLGEARRAQDLEGLQTRSWIRENEDGSVSRINLGYTANREVQLVVVLHFPFEMA